jgi:hypothetical protein
LLYYITPFALSLAIVAFRELVLDIKPLIEAEPPPLRTPRKSRNDGKVVSGERRPRGRRARRRAQSAAT